MLIVLISLPLYLVEIKVINKINMIKYFKVINQIKESQ